MAYFVDGSTSYAENHNHIIHFMHIPTGKTAWFKAFITDFEDTYDSEWNDVNVYGRMDPISTFQGTRRTINFSFDVVASGLEEAAENFEHSRRLIKMLYPVYEQGPTVGAFNATSLQAPPLLKLQFSNLIAGPAGSGLVGKLSGIGYKPDFEVGVFEGVNHIFPKLNRFNCSYTVFHTEGLGYDEYGRDRSPLFPYYVTTGYEPPTVQEAVQNASEAVGDAIADAMHAAAAAGAEEAGADAAFQTGITAGQFGLGAAARETPASTQNNASTEDAPGQDGAPSNDGLQGTANNAAAGFDILDAASAECARLTGSPGDQSCGWDPNGNVVYAFGSNGGNDELTDAERQEQAQRNAEELAQGTGIYANQILWEGILY